MNTRRARLLAGMAINAAGLLLAAGQVLQSLH